MIVWNKEFHKVFEEKKENGINRTEGETLKGNHKHGKKAHS